MHDAVLMPFELLHAQCVLYVKGVFIVAIAYTCTCAMHLYVHVQCVHVVQMTQHRDHRKSYALSNQVMPVLILRVT